MTQHLDLDALQLDIGFALRAERHNAPYACSCLKSALLVIDRLRKAEEASKWQPIATAPKDGSTILLGAFNSHGKWRTMRGQWMSETYIAECWEEPDDVDPGWFETCVEADDVPNCWRIEPTHWQPLPAAPDSTPTDSADSEGEKNANTAV